MLFFAQHVADCGIRGLLSHVYRVEKQLDIFG